MEGQNEPLVKASEFLLMHATDVESPEVSMPEERWKGGVRQKEAQFTLDAMHRNRYEAPELFKKQNAWPKVK